MGFLTGLYAVDERRKKMKIRAGFTLAELVTLAAMAFAAVLFFLIPAISESGRPDDRAACKENLRGIGKIAQLYTHMYDGHLLPWRVMTDDGTVYWYEVLINSGLVAETDYPGGKWECPAQKTIRSERHGHRFFWQWTNHYHYGVNSRMGSNIEVRTGSTKRLGLKADNVINPDRLMYFSEPNLGCYVFPRDSLEERESVDFRHDGYANLLFIDGHVESWDKESLPIGSEGRNSLPWLNK